MDDALISGATIFHTTGPWPSCCPVAVDDARFAPAAVAPALRPSCRPAADDDARCYPLAPRGLLLSCCR